MAEDVVVFFDIGVSIRVVSSDSVAWEIFLSCVVKAGSELV